MLIREFYFNNKKSFTDYNLYIEKFEIQPPVPIVKEVSIPYRNGSYDFSKANSPERNFSNRLINITVFWKSIDNIELFKAYSQLQNWLFTPFSSEIIIDNISGIFKGKVKSISSIEILKRIAKFTITFECDPFKYNEFGNQIWDIFNFEKDISAINYFTIPNKCLVFNSGLDVYPTFILESEVECELIYNNITYKLAPGLNNNILKLSPGLNKLTVNGTGALTINFTEKSF